MTCSAYTYSSEGILSHFELPLLYYCVHRIWKQIAHRIWDQAERVMSTAGKEEDTFRVFPDINTSFKNTIKLVMPLTVLILFHGNKATELCLLRWLNLTLVLCKALPFLIRWKIHAKQESAEIVGQAWWQKQHRKAFWRNVILVLNTEDKIPDVCVTNPGLLWWMGFLDAWFEALIFNLPKWVHLKTQCTLCFDKV